MGVGQSVDWVSMQDTIDLDEMFRLIKGEGLLEESKLSLGQCRRNHCRDRLIVMFEIVRHVVARSHLKPDHALWRMSPGSA
jgi:hypothetical protein